MLKPPEEEEVWPELQQLLDGLGDRVKELRARRGLTQKDLAAACDLKQPYIYEIERGTANLTMRTLLRVSNALGVTPRDLLAAAQTPDTENRVLLGSVTRMLTALRKIVEDEHQVVGTLIDRPKT